jgi:hypothetical protein
MNYESFEYRLHVHRSYASNPSPDRTMLVIKMHIISVPGLFNQLWLENMYPIRKEAK